MSSPKIVPFFIFDPVTGNPVTGQASSMSFGLYVNEAGTAISQPTIVEVGGGAYYFTPTFSVGHCIFYVLATGAGANPSKFSGCLRPEDFNTDNIDTTVSSRATSSDVATVATAVASLTTNITDLHDEAFGKWTIVSGGGDANKLILYRPDGVTVLQKFALTDASGTPTVTNPFSRTPTA